MSKMTLTKIRFANGRWEGRITGAAAQEKPDIEVRHLDRPVDGVALIDGDNPGQWEIGVPIPAEALADGVQTFIIRDVDTDTKLGDFTLIAGDAAADDLRAEVDLLRAELDMLKRAFRRHCSETK